MTENDTTSWILVTFSFICLNIYFRYLHFSPYTFTFQRLIDVLKIDVEGYEWNILEYLLQENLFKNIKQFMLEYHLFPSWPSKEDYPKLLKIYKSLHDIGLLKFVTAMHPLNLKPKSFNIQADVAYVNTLFKSNPGKV